MDRVPARFEGDGSTDLLAHLGVGNPDHRSLGYRGVLVENFFDLPRVHVEAAADDHVLGPVDDEVIALVVAGREVTCTEPIAPDHVGGRLRPVPVALHHVRAFDRYLSDLPLADVIPVTVDQPHFDAGDRGSDRAGLPLAVRVVEGSHRRRLGQSIPLKDRAAEFRLETFEDLDRQRCSARHAQAQG